MTSRVNNNTMGLYEARMSKITREYIQYMNGLYGEMKTPIPRTNVVHGIEGFQYVGQPRIYDYFGPGLNIKKSLK